MEGPEQPWGHEFSEKIITASFSFSSLVLLFTIFPPSVLLRASGETTWLQLHMLRASKWSSFTQAVRLFQILHCG